MDETKKTVSTKTKSIFGSILAMVIGIIIGLLIVAVFGFISDNLKSKNSDSVKIIKLSEVIIAHAPETKQIIFLDRKTNQVQFALSDSVSLAIFALKTAEVVSDYSSSMVNKQKQDIKK